MIKTYKKHEIKITEGANFVKAEVTIKGKEFGLRFKKDEKKEAIKRAKETIDLMSQEESKVIDYKGTTIYVIKMKGKFLAKGIYEAYGVGNMLVEEAGDTALEAIRGIKKSIRAIDKIGAKMEKRDEKEKKDKIKAIKK